MRVEGGTPWQHIRDIFLKYDFNRSFGIDPQELLYASRKHMYLDISPEQAKAIIKYYDIDKKGEIYYNKIVDDVCVGVKPILYFTELTENDIKEEKEKQQKNPFIPKPFKSRSCRVLESIKRTLKNTLNKKVSLMGGIWTDYLREAFVAWDPRGLGKLGSWDHVVGVFKRLGIKISKDEAVALIALFDRDKTGELVYEEFLKEIGSEDFHFMGDNTPAIRALEEPATARTPPEIRKIIKLVFTAIEAYSRKSKGLLNSRDVFHGTCLRYDKLKNGRLSDDNLKTVMNDLSCSISSAELRSLLSWFDTNGSNTFEAVQKTSHLAIKKINNFLTNHEIHP
jgi:Ca2+-binding EF-hand superfamily protein